MTLFGHLSTWLWIAGGWIIAMLISSLLFGLIARFGAGEEEGE